MNTFSVSAYWDGSGAHPYQGLTKSGEYTRPGVIACGEVYEFGTRFLVKGTWYECKDRGSAVTDTHLDIWFPSEEEALEWGRQHLDVIILPPLGG